MKNSRKNVEKKLKNSGKIGKIQKKISEIRITLSNSRGGWNERGGGAKVP